MVSGYLTHVECSHEYPRASTSISASEPLTVETSPSSFVRLRFRCVIPDDGPGRPGNRRDSGFVGPGFVSPGCCRSNRSADPA
ncbi:hypothetical protein BGZ61DRAFT_452224 [Ilyonectria robusta]|uniref:uncharacterized protein n=1 Tax=Ilyonectria robusta TaxID=1079257 RepID=UPI001E8D8063|nr:uncharacterized protein BGZ61DRAFT_452224 [Ilyonectria robusta]KAH8694636.1 hypothetical protein BGZ61DRAFT_452224 [Ilyonectria robusta]